MRLLAGAFAALVLAAPAQAATVTGGEAGVIYITDEAAEENDLVIQLLEGAYHVSDRETDLALEGAACTRESPRRLVCAIGAGVKVSAGGGDDEVYMSGQFGDLVAIGGNGEDTIDVEDSEEYGGTDTFGIFGGGGADVIDGSDGADFIDAGPGADEVEAVDGADEVLGGDGDDRLAGDFLTIDDDPGDLGSFLSEGGDTVAGGEGDDRIEVGARSTAAGEAGDDTVWGFKSTTSGGPGADDVLSNKGVSDCGPGPDRATIGYGRTLVEPDCELLDERPGRSVELRRHSWPRKRLLRIPYLCQWGTDCKGRVVVRQGSRVLADERFEVPFDKWSALLLRTRRALPTKPMRISIRLGHRRQQRPPIEYDVQP